MTRSVSWRARAPEVVAVADSWERPARDDELRPVQGRSPRPIPPYRPRDADDAPAGSIAALAGACGLVRADETVVLPPSLRPTTRDVGGWVVAPWRVLGVGPRGLGLWVADAPDGTAGVRRVVPLDDLAALDDSTVLLSGRLRLEAHGGALEIAYSTVARPALEPLLAVLRVGAAGPDRLPVADREVGTPDRDRAVKWRLVATSPAVRLDRDGPATIVYGRVPGGSRRSSRAALVGLTERELVVAREPASVDPGPGYGVDVLQVARARLEGVRFEHDALVLRSRGIDLRIALDRGLAIDADAAIGPGLPRLADATARSS
jgi:hypothetical protein